MRRAARTARIVLAMACPLGWSVVGAAAADEPVRYEDGGSLRASELLPPELLRGPHHAVEESVSSDGFVPTFTLRTDEGTLTVRGEALLRTRIAEVEALARLRRAARTEEFQAAAEKAPPLPFVSGGWKWARDPDAAAPGLPAGALAGGSWGEAGTGDASASPVLIGFERERRKLAALLGVDAYASDPALREELDRQAWVAFSTGTQIPIDPVAGASVPTGDSARVLKLLEDYSSEDLERLNRLELVAMGVPEELREQFIDNPSYSPRRETALIDALTELEGTDDRVSFIQAAVDADSEEAAESFQKVAEMLRRYSDDGGGLAKLLQVDGQVAAYTRDGTLVVPVMADHAVWTERVEGFAESIAKAAGESPEAARARLLVSGSVSSRALDEMRERGIDVTEEALGPAEETPDAAEKE